jgi:hypothetical protein
MNIPDCIYAIIATYLRDNTTAHLYCVEKAGCVCVTEIIKEKGYYTDDDENVFKGEYQYTYVNGQLQSLGDIPSVVFNCDIFMYREWHKKGKLHRENDQPAIMEDYTPEGVEDEHTCIYNWYTEGELTKQINYKEDRAIFYFYRNGILHREGDNPAIIIKSYPDNTLIEQHFYKEGNLHRDNDNPAVITEDTCTWYINGLESRESNKPSFLVSYGNHMYMRYQKNGKYLIRYPSQVSINLSTNEVTTYYWNGYKHVPYIEKNLLMTILAIIIVIVIWIVLSCLN